MLPLSILTRLRNHAVASDTAALKQGRDAYRRDRDLPKLLPLLSPEATPAGHIRAHLRAALAKERRLGAEGHWRYDLTRHKLLAAALAGEMQAAKNKRRP